MKFKEVRASFQNYDDSLTFIYRYVKVSFRILKSEVWYCINYKNPREQTYIIFLVTPLKEKFKIPKYVILKWLQFCSNRWRQTTERRWCEEEAGWGSYRGCRHDEYSFVLILWYLFILSSPSLSGHKIVIVHKCFDGILWYIFIYRKGFSNLDLSEICYA